MKCAYVVALVLTLGALISCGGGGVGRAADAGGTSATTNATTNGTTNGSLGSNPFSGTYSGVWTVNNSAPSTANGTISNDGVVDFPFLLSGTVDSNGNFSGKCQGVTAHDGKAKYVTINSISYLRITLWVYQGISGQIYYTIQCPGVPHQ